MISFSLFIGVLILILSQIYVWSKWYDQKIDYKKVSFYFYVIVLTMLVMLDSLYVNSFLRIIISTSIMIVLNWLVFKKKIIQTVVSTVYSQLILSIADVLSVIFFVLFLGRDVMYVKDAYFHTIISNTSVSIVYICICWLPFIKKIYYKILYLTSIIKKKTIIYFVLLLIVSLNFLMSIIYYDMKSGYVIVINTLLLLLYSFIVYKSATERSVNIMIEAENKSLMQSLNEYENMVDRQRVDNHENKNQLLIIKNMIKKKDKDVIEYIDTIVKDEHEEDEVLYTRVKTIPTGGLQGIIYQKMLTMKSENILFSLDVSRDVRKIDLSSFSMEDNYKLCKIIGVILDNAIEESKNLGDKVIMISLYVDEDMFVIDISNRFKSDVEIDMIDKEGYTTKGEGHGYGLSLVKQIIDESNGKFINDRKVSNDVFKQTIKVKI